MLSRCVRQNIHLSCSLIATLMTAIVASSLVMCMPQLLKLASKLNSASCQGKLCPSHFDRAASICMLR